MRWKERPNSPTSFQWIGLHIEISWLALNAFHETFDKLMFIGIEMQVHLEQCRIYPHGNFDAVFQHNISYMKIGFSNQVRNNWSNFLLCETIRPFLFLWPKYRSPHHILVKFGHSVLILKVCCVQILSNQPSFLSKRAIFDPFWPLFDP